MDFPPNELEIAVLRAIAAQTPDLLSVVERLRVSTRELSGAGSYTNFLPVAATALADGYLVLEKAVRIPGISDGLGAALAIVDGVPEILELFTHGIEEWDGTYDGFVVGDRA